MNRLAEAIDSPTPTIAAVFTGTESDETIDQIAALGVAAEFRADLAAHQEPDYLMAQSKRLAKMPLLLTVRILPEGGRWSGGMAKRRQLFETLMPEVDGVDVELFSRIAPTIIEEAHQADKVAIASRHNFGATPTLDDLKRLLNYAKSFGADYFKIAAKVNNYEDFLTLKQFTSSHDGQVIAIAMGDFRRQATKEYASKLVYASAEQQPLAPGQMTVTETLDLLKQPQDLPNINGSKVWWKVLNER